MQTRKIGIYYTYFNRILALGPAKAYGASVFPSLLMRLTTHTDYALRLLIFLMTHHPRKMSTKEAAAAYGISLNHLTKVAKALAKGGWVLTSKGVGGGLALAPHTPETTLGEIVRYSEPSCDVAECFRLKDNTCPLIAVCRLKPVLYRARQAFFDVLNEVTIQDIAKNVGQLRRVLE